MMMATNPAPERPPAPLRPADSEARRLSGMIFVAGQSLASRFRLYGREAFAEHLQAIAPDLGDYHVTGSTAGGSVASSNNYFPNPKAEGAARRWWWNADTGTEGPALVEALEAIEALGARNWSALVFDLGQHEAIWKALGSERSFQDIALSYAIAVPNVLRRLREALSPADPEALPILFVPLGPQKPSGRMRRAHEFGPFRAMQYEIIAATPNCHAVGSVIDMDMQDMLHPSQEGVEYYARKVAEKFAWVLKGGMNRAS
jgi:hypothetical protein